MQAGRLRDLFAAPLWRQGLAWEDWSAHGHGRAGEVVAARDVSSILSCAASLHPWVVRILWASGLLCGEDGWALEDAGSDPDPSWAAWCRLRQGMMIELIVFMRVVIWHRGHREDMRRPGDLTDTMFLNRTLDDLGDLCAELRRAGLHGLTLDRVRSLKKQVALAWHSGRGESSGGSVLGSNQGADGELPQPVSPTKSARRPSPASARSL